MQENWLLGYRLFYGNQLKTTKLNLRRHTPYFYTLYEKEYEIQIFYSKLKFTNIILCPQDKEDRDEREKRGMVSNHSYVITAVEEIPYKSGTTKLIRVRNPWGDTEWNGAWCDG